MGKKILLTLSWCAAISAAYYASVFLIARLVSVVVSVTMRQAVEEATEGETASGFNWAVVGFIAAPFLVLPFYKLALKLAGAIEKKWGVKIDRPGRLFALSLLLPFFLLMLLEFFVIE